MTVYRYRDKWKAEVFVNGNRVAAKPGFETKALGQKWHDEVRTEYLRGNCPTEKKTEITFETLLKSCEDNYFTTLKIGTYRRYKIDLRLRIIPFFRFYRLKEIDAYLVEKFRAELLTKANLSDKSVNNCVSVLNKMFEKAVQWHMISNNPCQIKQLKIPEADYSWWNNKEDITKFIRASKRCPYYAAYRLGLDCGLRLGEVTGLSKQDIDFDKGQITIHRQWLGKEKCYGSIKNNVVRRIKLEKGSELYKILLEAVFKSPDPEIIFTTRNGRRVANRKLSGYHFKKWIKKAGVPNLEFHGLRHSFASWYMIKVGDIWSLQALLGHKDVRTTMKYAHHSEKHQRIIAFDWEKNSLSDPYQDCNDRGEKISSLSIPYQK